MFGLLNVHKRSGVTSRDVVNHIQRLVRPLKVGHAGTLDPLASGVLLVGLGPATRLVPYLQQMRKQYSAAFLLGRASDTDDIEGDVVELASPRIPDRSEIEGALPNFIGTIEQRPPSYSALKVQGRRAYALARSGQSVELSPRPITVYEISLVEYDYPVLRLDIECGSGTYIRAIGRDLAERLHTSAVMSELTRTAIGSFRLEEAISMESITEHSMAEHLVPALEALRGFPVVALEDDQWRRIVDGQFLRMVGHGFTTVVAAINSSNELVAVLRPAGLDQLRPEIVLQR